MSKRDTTWSEEKYKRYIAEGRGQGVGNKYLPWLNTQDYPSQGRAARVKSLTTNRIHHFFSDTQRRYFTCLDWEASVTDIREHYPMHGMEEVLGRYTDLNFKKFCSRNGIPYILTTTFLITRVNADGKETLHARSVKYASELEKKITQEKLEIERRYWEEMETDWKLVTNRDLNLIRVQNIEWINPVVSGQYSFDGSEELENVVMRRCEYSDGILLPIFKVIDKDYSLPSGTAIQVFKSLIAKRKIVLNLDEKINLRTPMKIIISANRDGGDAN